MSKFDRKYRVFKTACWPAQWKVGRFEDDDNATVNFFVGYNAADIEAERRNKHQKAQTDESTAGKETEETSRSAQ